MERLNPKPELPRLTERERAFCSGVLELMKVNGRPASEMLTESQLRIFSALVIRRHRRVQVLMGTQAGKSMTVALAVVVLTALLGEDVVIVAPSTEKALIIMRYVIEHLGDHPIFFSKLEAKSKLERLQLEESKRRIRFRNGGSVFIVSTDEKNGSKKIEAAMGQGASVVIEDESGLISDDTEATIFRMLAGKGEAATYVKVGNPFYSQPPCSHFYASWFDPAYHRIFADYEVLLREGRYTPEFVEEARRKPMFSVLYACEFPDTSVTDGEGYTPIVAWDTLTLAAHTAKEVLASARAKGGHPLLGVDVGAGSDETVRVVRFGDMAAVIGRGKTPDLMGVVRLVEADMAMGILPRDTFIDDIGVGRGVTDRLREKGKPVVAVNVGEAAKLNPDSFANLKAEMTWAMREWLVAGGKLDRANEAGWRAIPQIRTKPASDRKLAVEPKDSLRARLGHSPDVADALILTFFPSRPVTLEWI
jgi:hypothetical protein